MGNRAGGLDLNWDIAIDALPTLISGINGPLLLPWWV